MVLKSPKQGHSQNFLKIPNVTITKWDAQVEILPIFIHIINIERRGLLEIIDYKIILLTAANSYDMI